tara:strand:- start:4783 stop:5172 length:390 start_codon:yes stop_codon:yes gene_type:complete
MENQDNSPNKRQDKYKQFASLLKALEHCEHVEVKVQIELCRRIGITYKRNAFREVYKKKYLKFLKDNPTTNADAAARTSIPHKLLCLIKRQLEKEGALVVYKKEVCPRTGSGKVQHLRIKSKVSQLTLF